MMSTKLGLKAFGLCLLAALSVMAFAAAAAQANPGHVWVVDSNGTLLLLQTTVGIEALKPIDGILLSTFGAGETPIAILCTAILIHDGLLFTDGTSLGEVLFSSCATSISGLVKANCKPLEPIVAKVKNLLLHHNGDTYILFSPKVGLVFTTLHLGELCAAGENIEISGHLKAECGLLLGTPTPLWHHEDCNVHKLQHELQQAPLALFPNHHLKFGSKIATLHGDVKVVTNGSHAGLKWSVEALLP
jgi:hypothetical protein